MALSVCHVTFIYVMDEFLHLSIVMGVFYVNFMPKRHSQFATILLHMGFTPSPFLLNNVQKPAKLVPTGFPY